MKRSKNFIGGMLIVALFVFTNCDDSDDPDPCFDNGPIIHIVSVTGSVVGVASGSIEVNAYGGIAPYEYNINDSPYQSSGLFNNLASEEYDITARDDNNCVVGARVTVGEVLE